MLNLIRLFNALQPLSNMASDDARFSAMPIPSYNRHRLGKDAQGAPSLLIAVTNLPGDAYPPPTALEHLTVQHDVACRVRRTDGGHDESRFTIVRCVGDDPALHTHFLRIAETVVAMLGSHPSARDVTRAIDQLVELFRAMSETPRKSVQGLWAELLLLALAPDPAVAVGAWHATPEDRYDFNMGSQRIEVKSTANRIRAHQFSLDQLSAPVGTSVLIASLFVERAGAGQTVGDLLGEVREKVSGSPNLLLHLDQIVSLTLGSSWQVAASARFDRELAEGTLAYFESSDVPTVSLPVPTQVSAVHFTSNLMDVPPTDVCHWRAVGDFSRPSSGHKACDTYSYGPSSLL